MLLRSLPLIAVALACVPLHRALRFRGVSAQESLALAASLGVIVLATVSLLATRLEAFHPWLSAGGATALLAAATLGLRRRSGSREPSAAAAGDALGDDHSTGTDSQGGTRDRSEVLLLLALVVGLGLLYGLFPTYFLLSGQDPGVYLLFAAHIARTGGLVLDLPSLVSLNAQFGDAVVLGYPGIYSAKATGFSSDAAKLIPQFVHLFPALLANAWGPFDLEGLVRANAVIAAVGLTAFFAFARRLLGFCPALAATALLGVNPALVWHARLATTEPLMLVITFSGLLLLLIATDRASAAGAAAAGAVLALGVFNRIDAALSGVAIGGAVLGFLFAGSDAPPTASVSNARASEAEASSSDARGRARVLSWLLGGFFAVLALGFADAFARTPAYFQTSWIAQSAGALLALNGGVLLVGTVALLRLASAGRPATPSARLRPAVAMLYTVGLVGWILYALLLRPAHDSQMPRRALPELAWYVTVPGLLVGVAGMCWAVWRERWDRWLPWLLFGGFTLFLFSFRIFIESVHPWVSRRWIPYVFPAICFFGCYFFARLHAAAAAAAAGELTEGSSRLARGPVPRDSRRRGAGGARGPRPPAALRRALRWAPRMVAVAAAAAAVLYLANAFTFARPYLFRSMLTELPAQYAQLAAQLDPGQTHLTWSVHFASILTYLYERPTVQVNRYELGMEHLPILGTPPGKRWGPSLLLRQNGWSGLCGTYVEETKRKWPTRVSRQCYDASPFTMGVLSPGTAGEAGGPRVSLLPAATLFRSEVGSREASGSVRSTGERGWVLRGPGVTLPPGRYRATWEGIVAGAGELRFEVRERVEESPLAASQLDAVSAAGPVSASLDFVSAESTSPIEFAVWVEDRVQLELNAFHLEPAPPPGEAAELAPSGSHQVALKPPS